MTETIINYDDTPRKLIFDIDRLGDAETISGKSFGEVMANPLNGLMNIHVLKSYVYAGLRTDNPKIEMKDVSKIINAALAKGMDLRVIINDIQDALFNSGILKRPNEVDPEKN